VNVLDENIPIDQREQPRRWRIATRLIGADIAAKGVLDDAILPLLVTLPRPTFFTRDGGFYRRAFCHARYCLVVLGVAEGEVAAYSRRVLRHPVLRTHASRLGRVVRVSSTGVTFWQLNSPAETFFPWTDAV